MTEKEKQLSQALRDAMLFIDYHIARKDRRSWYRKIVQQAESALGFPVSSSIDRDPEQANKEESLFYVIDASGNRPDVGNASEIKAFPLSTLEECRKAISYYRDVEDPNFPYSIIDIRTGQPHSWHYTEEEKSE